MLMMCSTCTEVDTKPKHCADITYSEHKLQHVYVLALLPTFADGVLAAASCCPEVLQLACLRVLSQQHDTADWLLNLQQQQQQQHVSAVA
jgi:hypothetical protein